MLSEKMIKMIGMGILRDKAGEGGEGGGTGGDKGGDNKPPAIDPKEFEEC